MISVRLAKNAWRGGRGAARYTFTNADLAKTLGVRVERVRRLLRAKTFDPKDLASLVRFLAARDAQAQATIAKAVLLAAAGHLTEAAALLGVSRATLYRRAAAAAVAELTDKQGQGAMAL